MNREKLQSAMTRETTVLFNINIIIKREGRLNEVEQIKVTLYNDM